MKSVSNSNFHSMPISPTYNSIKDLRVFDRGKHHNSLHVIDEPRITSSNKIIAKNELTKANQEVLGQDQDPMSRNALTQRTAIVKDMNPHIRMFSTQLSSANQQTSKAVTPSADLTTRSRGNSLSSPARITKGKKPETSLERELFLLQFGDENLQVNNFDDNRLIQRNKTFAEVTDYYQTTVPGKNNSSPYVNTESYIAAG